MQIDFDKMQGLVPAVIQDADTAESVSYTHLDVYKRQVYVCTDGQSFKVFSCDNTTGSCDYQNYKNCLLYTSRCV